MLESLRELICDLNKDLPRHGLVTMTSGNVSGRDPDTGLVAIKPSGISFEELTPDDIVIMGMDGFVVMGKHVPSVDTATHLVVYRRRPDVMGVVHTHSNHATAFAAIGQPIPAVLTAIADEFGGAIPCGPYCQIGEEQIGHAIVDHIGHSPAILLQNHGVFTIGPTPQAAVKAAVMCEDVARTVFLAMQMGTPIPIPEDEVARAHRRYVEKYGQSAVSSER